MLYSLLKLTEEQSQLIQKQNINPIILVTHCALLKTLLPHTINLSINGCLQDL